jgi:hypothetical protein
MVLISIILGLGITEIMSSVAAIFRNRDRIVLHFPSIMWVALTCLSLVQFWWAVWDFGRVRVSFPTYVLILLVAMFHYLLTRVVLPNFASSDVVEQFQEPRKYHLESFYVRNVSKMCVVAVTTVLLILAVDWWVFRNEPTSTYDEKLGPRLVFLFLLAVVWITGAINLRNVMKEAGAAKSRSHAGSGLPVPETLPSYKLKRWVFWLHAACTLFFAVAFTGFIFAFSDEAPGKVRSGQTSVTPDTSAAKRHR